MKGGRAKKSVLFFFTYVHPGLKVIFFGKSYLLVMAYKGMVSIFLYLSPFWRNSFLLFSPFKKSTLTNGYLSLQSPGDYIVGTYFLSRYHPKAG